MKTVYIFIVFFAFATKFSEQTDCHWRELDLCAANVLLSLQGSLIPQSEEEIDKHCSYLTESVQCGHNYTDKCVSSLHRELFSFIMNESEQNMRKLCTRGSDVRKNLLKFASCLSDAWKDQQPCADDAMAALDKLDSSGVNKRITIACCTYQRFRQCGYNIIQGKCGSDAVDFVNHFVSLYLSEVPNILCSNFDPKSPKCQNILPPPGTPPNGLESNSALARFINVYVSST